LYLLLLTFEISEGGVTMVEFTHDLDMSEEKAEFVNNGKIRTEAFVPLEVRLPKERPEFAAPLKKLQELMGAEKFSRRISRLQNINKDGKNLLIVAGNERLRTLLLKEDLPAIMKAFDVDNVRIVGGSGFGGIDAF
jgi:hypothetical protein